MKNKHSSRANISKYRKAQQELESAYNTERQKYIQLQIDQIQSAHINKKAATAWQVVNEVSGRKKSTQGKIKANNQEERIQKWKGHFQGLLGSAPVITDAPIQKIIPEELPIKTGIFTEEELIKVLTNLKNGKACGLDNIPPEVWKTGNFNSILLQFCNEVYTQNTIQAWTEGCILPFPKERRSRTYHQLQRNYTNSYLLQDI